MSDSKQPTGVRSKNYDHFWNPLSEKIDRDYSLQVTDTVCAWSDLLGFGRSFKQSNWKPNSAQWKDVAARLVNAYRIHCKHSPNYEEFMLTLNDGIVRTRSISSAVNECLYISLWLRAAIWAHLDLNKSERNSQFPGTRTVITGGQRAIYSFPEVRLDDLVLNYTRKEPGPSKLSQSTGNPLLVCNPYPLQMNTAFSRAYILDEAGSRHGLAGSNIYIEKSFLDVTDKLCATDIGEYRVVKSEDENGLLYAIEYKSPPRNRPWCFGLLLDHSPGPVSLEAFHTQVFRLKKFFPNDENPEEFHFDCESK